MVGVKFFIINSIHIHYETEVECAVLSYLLSGKLFLKAESIVCVVVLYVSDSADLSSLLVIRFTVLSVCSIRLHLSLLDHAVLLHPHLACV